MNLKTNISITNAKAMVNSGLAKNEKPDGTYKTSKSGYMSLESETLVIDGITVRVSAYLTAEQLSTWVETLSPKVTAKPKSKAKAAAKTANTEDMQAMFAEFVKFMQSKS